MSRLEDLLAELGVVIDPQLFELARVHRSWAYENGHVPTNERLEFLGDSVLGVVVTEHLYRTFPELPEGQLARLRAAVVNTQSLADVARGLELGSLVQLGRGEVLTGGHDKASILADTTEAMIGAIFLSGGGHAASAFVHHLFDPLVEQAHGLGAGLDFKTSLQEICAGEGWAMPAYEVEQSGPDHARHFTAWCVINERRYGPGEGQNKKQAEQEAAGVAYAALAEETAVERAAADEAEPVEALPGA